MDGATRLALAAQAGDQLALDAFVRTTQADVWRCCAHLVALDAADDLTQETYVRFMRALPGFRGDASARTFLLSIARRTSVDEIRRRSRRRALLGRLRPGHVAEAADSSGQTELDVLVADLDTDRREAFVLTQVLGLSYAEAAEAIGCPIGTVRSRVARARRDLLDALGPDERVISG